MGIKAWFNGSNSRRELKKIKPMVDKVFELEEKYHSSLFNSWMADFISTKETEYHDMKGDTYGEDGKTSGTM